MAYMLPPLPPSDERSMQKNWFDMYYKRRSQEFWGEAEIIREEIKPDSKCDHEFRATQSGVECTKCRFGLIGPLEVREGKLFHKGEPLPL